MIDLDLGSAKQIFFYRVSVKKFECDSEETHLERIALLKSKNNGRDLEDEQCSWPH